MKKTKAYCHTEIGELSNLNTVKGLGSFLWSPDGYINCFVCSLFQSSRTRALNVDDRRHHSSLPHHTCKSGTTKYTYIGCFSKCIMIQNATLMFKPHVSQLLLKHCFSHKQCFEYRLDLCHSYTQCSVILLFISALV